MEFSLMLFNIKVGGYMKKIIILLLLLFMVVGCSTNKSLKNKYEGSVSIVLNGNEATIDGEKIEVYDYTWHVDECFQTQNKKRCHCKHLK